MTKPEDRVIVRCALTNFKTFLQTILHGTSAMTINTLISEWGHKDQCVDCHSPLHLLGMLVVVPDTFNLESRGL
ncbi:hypothetical protein TNCV_3025781 [Trichonephila clavipes]|nr:hypothetical protein TNCV_3025781 [Trichonephila clavipes]